ncbi:MAG: 2-succinyl-5-enolpyruvyl-6-hydroxy-3-cyclohexene-1-carboxylic-acid synthase, partial [Ktedonobacterales bacterium]
MSSDSTHPFTSTAPANALYAYVGAFIEELGRSGVRNAVICPGSRSTPLALALADQHAIRTWMHVDERSAAFFALGIAKRLREPVVLVCTSGTAAANFFPAVVEANLSYVPLLVLTADRPHELRDNGAPQAIDQNRLYGTHAKWYADVELPEATNEALRYIRTLACRAAATSLAIPAGPVHLNFLFREPLTPDPQPLPPLEQRDPIAWNGRPGGEPYTRVAETTLGMLPDEEVQRLASLIQEMPRGLIVVGSHVHADIAVTLSTLAAVTQYPILADPLSGLRANSGKAPVISSYDAFLHEERFSGRAEPQLVLRFGVMPTSKPLLLYLKRHAAHSRQIVIDGTGRWEEPTQLAAEVLHVDPVALCQRLAELVRSLIEPTPGSQSIEPSRLRWLRLWQAADAVTSEALADATSHFTEMFEGRVFLELAELLPDGANLFVGSSMPVRDCDTFFWPRRCSSMTVLGNRGANGIDGVTSTALGVSAVSGDTPTVLVIGDLSFYHDLNGLLAARLHQLNLTVVLVNNDGGGIFSFLPQAAYPEHFE